MQNYKSYELLADSDKRKCRDSQKQNIYVKSIPSKIFLDRKDVLNRDWQVENKRLEIICKRMIH